jgi:sulfide dehydrogenase cytochrome subunit
VPVVARGDIDVIRHPAVAALATAVTALFILAAPLAAQAQATAPDMVLARNLAATCANCHGTNGNARGDMKPLAGMPADKLVALMADYRAGNLPATIMHQIVKGYTEDQIRLIAAHFAVQKPAK